MLPFSSSHCALVPGNQDLIDEKIKSVMKQANIWDHFGKTDKFPQGLNTNYIKFSGGEKRSVGLARAMLSTPSILLLDEPTEGLSLLLALWLTVSLAHCVPGSLCLWLTVSLAHWLSEGLDAQNEKVVVENLIHNRPKGQTVRSVSLSLLPVTCSITPLYTLAITHSHTYVHLYLFL